MKKLMALLIAGAMVFGCVACGNGTEDKNGSQANVEIKDANEILTKAWDEYTENASEEMKFPVAGGNMATAVMDAPETFDLSAEGAEEELISSYCIPSDSIAMIDDAATLMNMMMANNFTAAAYHVADAKNVETVIANIKDTTINNPWMCGLPDSFIIVTVGDDYVVSAYGNAECIDVFKTAITTVYGDAATVSVEEAIAE